MADSNPRIEKIAQFVRARLDNLYRERTDREELDRYLSHADYRWQHTLRVAQYGKLIAEAEGADVELVVAACLLHDVAWFDPMDNDRDHGRVGSDLARPFLKEIGYSNEQVETICHSIAVHVDVENPDGLEAKAVTDADNIDRFGPYRILQWCFSDIDDYARLTDKLRERIQRLEGYHRDNPLTTPTGRKLFAEQLDMQLAFFKAFVGEHEVSIMPRI